MEVPETFDMAGVPDAPVGKIPEPQPPKRNWLWLLLPFLAFTLSLGISLLDLREWRSPEFWIHSERLAAGASDRALAKD